MGHRHSIILRSGLTLGSIVLLALFSMASSIFIAESSKSDAAAINLAGSLRMQSYRIATRLQYPAGNANSANYERVVKEEIHAFERRLAQLWQTGAISLTVDNPHHQTLKAIEAFWQGTLQPVLEIAIATANPAAYLREVDDFVIKIDTFVKLLEETTEAKIRLLRLVQGLALFMTLALVLIAMHQLHTGVVTRLRDLVKLAHRARHGDLSVRAQHTGNDELGVLGQAFNLMAADLSTLYANLEARVEAQTQALRVSNRSLDLLYHTTRRLSESTLSDATTYQALLAEIEKFTALDSVRLCLIDPTKRQATRVFTAGTHAEKAPPFCERPHCEACLGDGATHPLTTDYATFSIPIRDQQQQFGVLIVRNPERDSVAAWLLPLLEAVARHIATTLQANQQVEHRRRLALLEERNAMARDLHDSLAQTLSYLKIQVTRLYASVSNTELTLETRDIITELREGLNDAYRELRELIATFRLKIEHPRLEDSLREVAREFSRRSRLPVELDSVGWNRELNPNEQIHVLQIVREALNNAIKHARARQLRIRLDGANPSQAVIEVIDDGAGLPDHMERDDHFGFSIMRERAKYLNGILDIHSRPGQGVRVRLRFQPTSDIRLPSLSLLGIDHAG
ncbi:MAG: type IV pili methyl-accepting chemotaxis transducer N-terminal domain-containing protein [Candidatus Competibacteraceae bacterium]|nr:type IV pili methyl-accepting chemotaxis transducer N-terminal domain-containing protein [Candidatus Competibacteraceae bacterium]